MPERGKVIRAGIDARVLGRRGVGRYLQNLVNALLEVKFPLELTLFLQEQSRLEGVPDNSRIKLVFLKKTHPAWAEQIAIPCLAYQKKLDLIHYPDNTGAWKSKTPTVLTMHDVMWQRPLDECVAKPYFRQRLQDWYRKIICPLAVRSAFRVITVSHHSGDDLILKLGIKKDKIRIIPEAVDSFFKKKLSSGEVSKKVRALGINRPFFLCSGAADTRKNIDRLIQALAELPLSKRPLLVITSLSEKEKSNTLYEQTARKFKVADKIFYTGYVDDETLKALYQGAQAYVFPSLWEGFGLPVLEAFALEVPVIASNTSALVETAGNGARLVDPFSVKALALALKEAGSKKFKKHWVPRGLKQLKIFSWRKAALKTLAVYKECLKGF
jgi:glycosyltransferase involved in cell wall biosynthesis